MRAFSLAAVAILLGIAACSDAASPIAMGPDATVPTAVGGAARFFGGKKFDARGTHRHNNGDYKDGDKQECGDDDHDAHWGRRGHDHSRWHSHWGKQGRHNYRWGMRGHRSHDPETGDGDCGGGDAGGDGGGDGGSGEEIVATITGVVMANGAGATSYPVFLLDAGGTTVVANTATATDGTGSYSFADVAPGTYMVCEDNPFTEAHGYLGEARPASGASCPSGYAPRGFAVTVEGGATAAGNDFTNYDLE